MLSEDENIVYKHCGPAHLPIYLSLLVDYAMGLFSGYPTMEPQLSYVDNCRVTVKHS